MKRLTAAEEQVMLILWKKRKAFVKEILADLPDPKPAYNTVSTVVRILETKGFVGYESFGRTHQYFPLINQEEYSGAEMNKLLKDHFNGSAKRMLSFFMEKQSLSLSDLDGILKQQDKID